MGRRDCGNEESQAAKDMERVLFDDRSSKNSVRALFWFVTGATSGAGGKRPEVASAQGNTRPTDRAYASTLAGLTLVCVRKLSETGKYFAKKRP